MKPRRTEFARGVVRKLRRHAMLATCHAGAEQGDSHERNIRIPR